MKKITVNKTRILTAAAALVAVFSLAGCGSNAVQEIPRSAETSRSEEATPETAAPEATATPAPTPEPAPAVVVPTSVTLDPFLSLPWLVVLPGAGAPQPPLWRRGAAAISGGIAKPGK